MRLGILTGLASEAAIARLLWPEAEVRSAASRPAMARLAAKALIEAGAERLLSFGLAGGLAPELQPGALVVATDIRAEQRRYPCTPDLRELLATSIPEAMLGPLFGSESVVASPDEKLALMRRSGALALDMESLALAEAASAAGRPFAALRAIADPFDRALPRAALAAVDLAGKPDVLAVLRGLLARPQDLPALIRLGRDSARAHGALRSLLGRAGLRLLVT